MSNTIKIEFVGTGARVTIPAGMTLDIAGAGNVRLDTDTVVDIVTKTPDPFIEYTGGRSSGPPGLVADMVTTPDLLIFSNNGMSRKPAGSAGPPGCGRSEPATFADVRGYSSSPVVWKSRE